MRSLYKAARIWREWTWTDAFEDARHPPADEPHAQTIAVVKILILVAVVTLLAWEAIHFAGKMTLALDGK
jgi:hypothetical protein